MHELARSLRLALAPLLTLASSASAQVPSFHFDGVGDLDWFGHSARPAGDVNGDGTVDFIVGASQNLALGHSPFPGYARVFSGVDGALLHHFSGDGTFWSDGPDDHFGAAVDGAGDVNLDGYADLIIGAYKDDDHGQNSGMFRVHSGFDGTELYTQHGDTPGDRQGYALAGLQGDVDGDGIPDLVVGVYKDDALVMNGGAVRICSGATGDPIYEVYGPAHSDLLGYSVARMDDLDGDGIPEFIAGAPQLGSGLEVGYARVYSGIDGALLFHVMGDADDDMFGYSVTGLGDATGDGVPDFAVGASQGFVGVPAAGPGYVRAFSGADGTELVTLHGDESGDAFGWAISGAGDVNGDGLNDLVVGAPRMGNLALPPGYARVYAALDGTELQRLSGVQSGDWFGVSVSTGTDLDGDGYSEVFIGCSEDITGSEGEGYADLYPGMCSPSPERHCTLAPNSVGAGAEIGFTGSVSVSVNNLGLEAGGCPPFHFGIFFYGPDAIQVPFGDGFLCIGGPIQRLDVVGTDGSGSVAFPVDLANPPTSQGQIVPGATWSFQFWYRDPFAFMAGFNLSDALRLTFCP